MNTHDDNLFRIGEITKILGVTRKALLIYENMGLLTPAVKDESSGYRYYTADNMTQIRSIQSLQSLGLSLKEIADYYCNTENMDADLQRLIDLRAVLDHNIQRLQIRAVKHGDMTVHSIVLPRQVCYVCRYTCHSISEATTRLRDTYIAAARTGLMSTVNRMFTVRLTVDTDAPDLLCCIPIQDSFSGAERMEFAETPALCIYYRGPYEGIGSAIHVLTDYMAAHNITAVGPPRSIYLEGPPNRGENSMDYITQIAIPTADRLTSC